MCMMVVIVTHLDLLSLTVGVCVDGANLFSGIDNIHLSSLRTANPLLQNYWAFFGLLNVDCDDNRFVSKVCVGVQ